MNVTRRIVDLIEVRQRSRIAGFVLPGLEVHGFARPDAQQDSQDFEIGDVLSERRIQARPALLDKRKVESRRKGDRFEVVGEGGVE